MGNGDSNRIYFIVLLWGLDEFVSQIAQNSDGMLLALLKLDKGDDEDGDGDDNGKDEEDEGSGGGHAAAVPADGGCVNFLGLP